MSKKWRNKPTKHLATRAISKEELPALIDAMKKDSVTATITSDGIKWHHGDYRVTKKAVADVWGLTLKQMERVSSYIYSFDPFDESYSHYEDFHEE